MVDVRSILAPTCTRAGVATNSRKRLLEYASDLLAETYELPARELFDELMNRERLGSTGLGDGVAIPHCRIDCDRIHAACLTLDKPVDYDAMDGEPVDLVFVLIVPPEENSVHLELLAALARLYGNPESRARLRACRSDDELFELFTGLFSSQAA
ncbi:MAG: PTS sugar transporter subunit IIA [Pseudomonadales bacterium]|jgi:PTS system nitrogen regulatory IIA component